MATIHKLKKDGSTIYPATIADAVVHQDTGATLTEMVDSYNVTHLYPTSGLSGGSTYNLSGAIIVLASHLTTAEKKTGIHVVFTDSDNVICDYIYQGGTFTNTSSWTLSGDVHTAPDAAGSVSVPDFDPYTDTLHVSKQTLSETQQKLAFSNLGGSHLELFDGFDSVSHTISQTSPSVVDEIKFNTALGYFVAHVTSGDTYHSSWVGSDSYQELVGVTMTPKEKGYLYDGEVYQYTGEKFIKAPEAGYYVCSTAASTQIKDINAYYALKPGGNFHIKFTYANTDTAPKLRIGSSLASDAKTLYYNGRPASATNTWKNNEVVSIYYDGTNYQANSIFTDDGIFDVTAYNDGTTFASLSALLSDDNLSTLIPVAKRKGGMSIKFVQTSENKYVQYFLTKDEWSTNVLDWQKITLEEEIASFGYEKVLRGAGTSAVGIYLNLIAGHRYMLSIDKSNWAYTGINTPVFRLYGRNGSSSLPDVINKDTLQGIEEVYYFTAKECDYYILYIRANVGSYATFRLTELNVTQDIGTNTYLAASQNLLKEQIDSIALDSTNNLMVGSRKIVEGVGFNAAIRGAGSSLVGTNVHLLRGHKYRVNVVNPLWDRQSISGNILIINSFDGSLQTRLLTVISDEPVRDYYDITVPLDAESININVRATNNEEVYFQINDFEAPSKYEPSVSNNSLLIGNVKCLDGVGFNHALIGAGDTLQGVDIHLIAGHKYRVNIINPSWNITGISAYIFYLSTLKNSEITRIASIYSGEPVAEYYDFVMPVDADYANISIRAVVGEVVYFQIEDISATTQNKITHLLPDNIGQLNAVKRMRQLTDIEWTPVFDIPRLGLTYSGTWFADVFKAGKKYKGVPYARAYKKSTDYGYDSFKIGLFMSIETFITAVSNKGTVVEDQSSINLPGHEASFYATVCAAACSYALGLPYVATVQWQQRSDMDNLGKVNNNGTLFDLSSLKLGDILNDPTVHTAIVTDVIVENSTVKFIEVAESTPEGNENNAVIGTSEEGGYYGGTTRRLWWSPSDFYSYWANFSVLRYQNIADVTYTPCPYVPMPDENYGYAPHSLSCLPYMGNKFRYKYGKVANSTILIIETGFTKMRVIKDGNPWNIDGTDGYYDITSLNSIDLGFTDIGEYSAYLCNVSDGVEVKKSYPCQWSVVSSITPNP